MDSIAMIGQSIRIKGEVTAREPLTIAGHVDGTIDADGHAVTIEATGRIQASITAHSIIIGGTVTGRIAAGGRIVVRETAKVDGELTAPAVSLADGATVHGKVETAPRGSMPRLVVATSAA